MRSLAAALDLARAGLPVFPCLPSKAPACRGGHTAASSDPGAVAALWRRYPGELVGVVTGGVSGVDVLDLDIPRHVEAREWWQEVRSEMPATRRHKTRSGGLHLFFRHEPGLRCWVGRPVIGIDARSTGGYIIWWPGAGLPVLQDAPLAPWPDWLLNLIKPPRPAVPKAWKPPALLDDHFDRYAAAALRHAADRVALAPAGARNSTLNAETFVIARFIVAGFLDAQTVAARMAAAGLWAGLTEREVTLTLVSALAAAGVA